MMRNPLFLLLLAACALVLFRWLVRSRSKSTGRGKLPYVLRGCLFTPCEQRFLAVLHELYGSRTDIDIYGKVRLADVFDIKKGVGDVENRRLFSNIAQKHVDYLIVARATCLPMVAIELDDSSHDRADRRSRDALVDQIYSSAGLPLVHIKAASSYDSADVRRQLREAMSNPANHPKPSLWRRMVGC